MISTPGVSAGTMNMDMPLYALTSGFVTAMTMRKLAKRAFDENHFSPSMTHVSPSRVAFVVNSVGSAPPWGSVIE
jgi:hypothetical protein